MSMLLYDCKTAPNPRRVRIFLAEKGIELESSEVDLRNGEQFSNEFMKINPSATVPVLRIKKNTYISDTIAICRYIEDLNPHPYLFGKDAVERAQVNALNRWCDIEGFMATMDAFRNSTPGLIDRALPGPSDFSQIPALSERSKIRIDLFFERLDALLSSRKYLAGSRFSIADITAIATLDFASWMHIHPKDELVSLVNWAGNVRNRPSMEA